MYNTLAAEERSVHRYFGDIAASKPLSREREVTLAARIKEGDMEARDELVGANLRFVVDVAKSYQHRGLSLLELISAGNLGLLTATDRFDGARGFKFISYAVWWIKQSIMKTLDEQVRTVRLPMNQANLLRNIAKASTQLGQKRETEPTLEEIAAELDVLPGVVLETMLCAHAVRLDNTFDEDDECSQLNLLADTGQKAPDDEVVWGSARNQLAKVLT